MAGSEELAARASRPARHRSERAMMRNVFGDGRKRDDAGIRVLIMYNLGNLFVTLRWAKWVRLLYLHWGISPHEWRATPGLKSPRAAYCTGSAGDLNGDSIKPFSYIDDEMRGYSKP
jgi:hypothetical protein